MLAPAYSCGSEIDALLKAGVTLDYYRILPDFSPDIRHLEQLCRHPAGALLITHYFGFAQPTRPLLDFARSHGLLLIEDNAHGFYSSDAEGIPLGRLGDMGVFSFSKTLPIPDGGALVLNTDNGADGTSLGGTRPEFFALVGKLKAIGENEFFRRSSRTAQVAKAFVTDPMVKFAKRQVYRTERLKINPQQSALNRILMDVNRKTWRMSSLAEFLLARVDHHAVREARRANYQTIDENFLGGVRVRKLMEALSHGCCPLFYPVWTDDAQALHEFLLQHDVESIRFWLTDHPAIPIERFPFERALKQHVLVLPVHQGLDTNDMIFIADLLARWDEQFHRNRQLG